MDDRQRPRTGTLLSRTGTLLGLGEDTALGDEDDVAVGEFLLELAGEPGGGDGGKGGKERWVVDDEEGSERGVTRGGKGVKVFVSVSDDPKKFPP